MSDLGPLLESILATDFVAELERILASIREAEKALFEELTGETTPKKEQ